MRASLNEPGTGREVFELLRGLIDSIILTPAKGKLEIESFEVIWRDSWDFPGRQSEGLLREGTANQDGCRGGQRLTGQAIEVIQFLRRIRRHSTAFDSICRMTTPLRRRTYCGVQIVCPPPTCLT